MGRFLTDRGGIMLTMEEMELMLKQQGMVLDVYEAYTSIPSDVRHGEHRPPDQVLQKLRDSLLAAFQADAHRGGSFIYNEVGGVSTQIDSAVFLRTLAEGLNIPWPQEEV